MKLTRITLIICLLLFLSLCLTDLLTGCVSSNPLASPPGQPTNNQPPYIVDPRFISTSNAVQNVAQFTAPFNPYSPITNPLATAVLGIIGTVSAWYMQKKNVAAAQATADDHLAVINTMATGIVKAGPAAITAVQAEASGDSKVLGQVAAHLNDATA